MAAAAGEDYDSDVSGSGERGVLQVSLATLESEIDKTAVETFFERRTWIILLRCVATLPALRQQTIEGIELVIYQSVQIFGNPLSLKVPRLCSSDPPRPVSQWSLVFITGLSC